MLAEYGTMSLAQVLAPAIEMADGYPIEAELSNTIDKYKDKIAQWPYSKKTLLIHPGEAREGRVSIVRFRKNCDHACRGPSCAAARLRAFQDRHLRARLLQSPTDGKSGHARTDHHDFHGASLRISPSRGQFA